MPENPFEITHYGLSEPWADADNMGRPENYPTMIERDMACPHCGATEGLYAHGDNFYCEAAYIATAQSSYGCPGCSTAMYPNDGLHYEDRIYCYDCAREHMDICTNCGQVQEQGSMRRINERPFCSRCHRPEWGPSEWSVENNIFDRVSDSFTFGVEIETSQSENYHDLEDNTLWGCVPEASTSGREFVSPVLCGDKGLDEIALFIEEWGDEWEINDSCGTHIHIGLHSLEMDQKKQVAYGYLFAWPFLAQLIGEQRATNSMCGSPQWSLKDLVTAEDIEDFAAARDRFEFVNWRSLLKYGTIEIRCLQGTLDAELIAAWICWHVAFIANVGTMEVHELKLAMSAPENFCETVAPDSLSKIRDWMASNQRSTNTSRLQRLQSSLQQFTMAAQTFSSAIEDAGQNFPSNHWEP